jgi:hypothetical protein
MRIHLASVSVDGQTKALDFYTNIPAFEPRTGISFGDGDRWLTVGTPGEPSVELLEPSSHPTVEPFRDALVAERLVALTVTFTQPPTRIGPAPTAVFDDTCGNLISIATQP